MLRDASESYPITARRHLLVYTTIANWRRGQLSPCLLSLPLQSTKRRDACSCWPNTSSILPRACLRRAWRPLSILPALVSRPSTFLPEFGVCVRFYLPYMKIATQPFSVRSGFNDFTLLFVRSFRSLYATHKRNAVDVGRYPEKGVWRAWVQGRAGQEDTPAASPAGASARATGAVF